MKNRRHGMRVCPRCGGNMLLYEYYEEIEEVCLQCGHRNYLASRYKTFTPKPAEWEAPDGETQPASQSYLT